jgi:hypothetical protein
MGGISSWSKRMAISRSKRINPNQHVNTSSRISNPTQNIVSGMPVANPTTINVK